VQAVQEYESERVVGLTKPIRPAGNSKAAGAPGQEDLRRDIALLRLDATPSVAPIPIGPLASAPPRIVSYNFLKSQAPSIEETCPALARIDEVLTLGCAAASGVSGAPVLSGEGGAAHVSAVVSAMGRLPDGGEFALGVMAGPWIGTLRAELDRVGANPTPAP